MSTRGGALLLFGSGAAALIYQALWVKQLALVVGVDVYAVTTGVSAFFAGLALGSAAWGRTADASPAPARLYAGLEVGIAVLGIFTTVAFAHVAPLFVHVTDTAGALAWVIPFACIGAPAFFMGGTLPALLRACAPSATELGASGGLLYAANTAGGVLGALAVPFALVPLLGVRGSALLAAAVNIALAALAASWPVRPTPGGATTTRPRGAPMALALYAVAGGIALGYEVVWSQAIVQFLNTRAYGFGLMLATYLAGLVLGSTVWATIADRIRRPWLAFAVLETSCGIAALATFGLLGPWLPTAQAAVADSLLASTGNVALATYARLLLAPVVLILPPTIVLGATFPAAVRLACGTDHVGRDVGAVSALNTAGGIAGTMLTGFVVVPALGLRGALVVLVVASVTVGMIAAVRGAHRRFVAGAVALGVIAAVAIAGRAIPPDHLAQLLVATRGGTLDAYRESPGGTVAVVREHHPAGAFRRLYIHGVSNSGDNMMSLRYMRLQALLPLLVHTGPARSALVVGLGTGITCGTLLAVPDLERRVCVELLPAVARLVDRFNGNFDVAHDPRIDLRIADGRHELLRDDTRWDLITLEPPPPTAAGIVNLYSRDFYQLCRTRLAPRGLMAQWLPLTTQNDEDARALVRSFLDVFPHATMWTTELHEMLLIGSMDPIVLDVRTIRSRFEQPPVSAALAEVGIDSVAALLATWVTDTTGLAAYAADAPPVTDDRPRIEHAGFIRAGEFPRVLRNLLLLRGPLPIGPGHDALVEAAMEERRRLTTFYQAGLHYYAGDAAKMEPLLRSVLSEDPDDPYYRWFTGGRVPGGS